MNIIFTRADDIHLNDKNSGEGQIKLKEYLLVKLMKKQFMVI